MADIARRSHMCPGQNKCSRVSVIGWGESSGRMAIRASVAESRKDMIRVLPILKICLVTRIAVGGCRGIACRMAADARHRRVFSGEREARCAVVKCRWSPCDIRVTCSAIVTESASYVIRTLGGLIASLMA